jgi:ribosomal protein S18 acetylase RimI-like enzyme
MIEPCALETEVFGRRWGRLVQGFDGAEDPGRDYDTVSVRVPAEEVDAVASHQAAGFRFAGALVELSIDRADIARAVSETRRPVPIVEAKSEHAEAAVALADSLEWSRFHNDPIVADKAPEFYRRWIRNAVAGRVNDGVLVAVPFGDVVGFVIHDPDRLILIAVRRDWRGRGVGAALAAMGLARTTAPRAHLGTEATSRAALNLYLGMGARFERTLLAFHWHREAK